MGHEVKSCFTPDKPSAPCALSTYRFMPQVEDERLAAQAVLRDREAYLRQLYTSFVPLWGKLWEEEPEESEIALVDTPTVTSREERKGEGGQKTWLREEVDADGSVAVSYTHLTLPTILLV